MQKLNVKKYLTILLLLVVVAVLPTSIGYAKENTKNSQEEKSYIVITKNNEEYEELLKEKSDKIDEEITNKEVFQNDNTLVVNMTQEEAKELMEESDILVIEEDVIITANSTNEEEEWDYQQTVTWNVNAVKGSSEQLGENANQDGIKIAILDSGIEAMSEIDVEERENLISGEEDLSEIYEDITGHGTSVAGIIGAKDDEEGIVGINPNALICSVKVFNNSNEAPVSRIIEGIQWAIDNDVKIINMSFGTEVESEALHLKIKEAYDAGILLIAAAGNDGAVEYPAAYDEVMAVGATTIDNELSSLSTSGTEVEIVAPGEGVLSTALLGGYMAVNGTSVSAPHVAAAASLLWAKDPSKSNDFIRQLLDASARNLEDDSNSGSGLLDIANAFEIYDEFSNVYEEGVIEYTSLSENTSELTEATEAYVVGSWGENCHNATITAGSSYVSANEVTIMKAASLDADQGAYAPSASMILHGGTVDKSSYSTTHTGNNYVSDVRYLYKAAVYTYKGYSLPATTIFDGVSDGIDTIAEYISEETLDISSSIDQTTDTAKAAKILGYAAHLTGDVYAHRTIVPDTDDLDEDDFSSSSSLCSTTKISKQAFLKSFYGSSTYCHHWDCLEWAIENELIETKDLTVWTTASKANALYEDNYKYLSTRYTAAKYSVKYLMKRYYTKATLGSAIFLPDQYNVTFGLKLNGLQEFYEETGYSVSLSDDEWDEISVSLR